MTTVDFWFNLDALIESLLKQATDMRTTMRLPDDNPVVVQLPDGLHQWVSKLTYPEDTDSTVESWMHDRNIIMQTPYVRYEPEPPRVADRSDDLMTAAHLLADGDHSPFDQILYDHERQCLSFRRPGGLEYIRIWLESDNATDGYHLVERNNTVSCDSVLLYDMYDDGHECA